MTGRVKTMTVSSLARASIITTKRNTRTHQIQKFTPHYMCAKWTGETCAAYFRDCDRQVSANYCIGYDGGIVCNVPEEYRAWTSSSSWNDQRAITVECANLPDGSLTQATWDSLVKLGADVMRRYGFRPWYTGDSSGTITEHMMFASTDCPGPWLHPRMGELAVAIKNELDGTKPAPAPEPEPEPEPKREPGGSPMSKPFYGQPFHRIANPFIEGMGKHHYTADPDELAILLKNGWKDEGVIGVIPQEGRILYRLENTDHLYTIDYSEAASLCIDGWTSEGEQGVAKLPGTGEVQVVRLYNPYTGEHLLTSSPGEVDGLVVAGWRDEGNKFDLDAK